MNNPIIVSECEKFEDEALAKLQDRFGMNTTIGENRHASDFLKEDIIPLLTSSLERALAEREREIVKILEDYRKTADDHPEPSEVHWVLDDILSKLNIK